MKYIFLATCFLSPTGSRTGGCVPLYSNSGRWGPDRQEGPAHQTTRTLRWSFYQGGFVSCVNRSPTSVRLGEPSQTPIKPALRGFYVSHWTKWHQVGNQSFFWIQRPEVQLILNDHSRSAAFDCSVFLLDCPSREPRCYWKDGYHYWNPRGSVQGKNTMNVHVSCSHCMQLFWVNNCCLNWIMIFFKTFSCIIVKSSGSLFVPIFPSLSLPHSLLFIPGPRSDIWEAEGGELLHSEGGGQIGDAH